MGVEELGNISIFGPSLAVVSPRAAEEADAPGEVKAGTVPGGGVRGSSKAVARTHLKVHR